MGTSTVPVPLSCAETRTPKTIDHYLLLIGALKPADRGIMYYRYYGKNVADGRAGKENLRMMQCKLLTCS